MRAYVITSGAIFGLLTAAHVVRVLVEGTHVLRDAWFVLFTILPTALCIWAIRLLRPSARS